ncbi:LexA family protein [Methylobacterium soli]|uniref:Translesion error-prone DNA polymerase V autoproteolytic subunit n=1 Tax=Methylobacterium soli TaxID=553447 RepID=A0A6L3SS53_9HYPH|nr:translesion error-prone DNA polymerase V autoproteolytic subunit [Methylobacterium soli]KAB1068909.1 translesion error-prone DNA polymerase V autoproteolytic subunit [Methylobacterium soli]GJE45725.1 Protein UmuD [Methylobacterium soli]
MDVYRIGELAAGSGALVHIPILGQYLCAGFPSPADDFLEGALELPRWLAPNPPATFAWNISGDSMRGAGIFDRDLAVVDRSLKAGHGSVVVAAIDGEMSIKRLVIDGNVPRLAFDNPDLPAFAVEEMAAGEIWGVVRFSIRWHIARAGQVR